MPIAQPMIVACLTATVFLLSAQVQAQGYAGFGLHGLHADEEHDGDVETNLSFSGPRIYGGWRFGERLALEVEAGRAEFRGTLFSDNINARFQTWNVAVTGIVHVPVDWPMRPYFYVGAGRSLWDYVVSDLFSPVDFSDASNDPYAHAGLGMEAALGDRLRLRIGYRQWRSDMRPREGQWAVNTDDYAYRRRGIELAGHWAF